MFGGLQRESVGLQQKYGVSNENLRVSNENLRVSNENMGVSNENMGPPIKIGWVSNKNMWDLQRESGCLQLDVHGGLQWVSNSTLMIMISSLTLIFLNIYLNKINRTYQ